MTSLVTLHPTERELRSLEREQRVAHARLMRAVSRQEDRPTDRGFRQLGRCILAHDRARDAVDAYRSFYLTLFN